MIKPEPEERRGWKQLGSRIHPDLLHHIRLLAVKRGCSMTVLVNEALIKIYGKPKVRAPEDLSVAS